MRYSLVISVDTLFLPLREKKSMADWTTNSNEALTLSLGELVYMLYNDR